jgi:hypothetical protein
MTDESSIGVWLWVALIVGINVTWISMDVWLKKHNHEYLTTEFREGLHNELLGPLLCALVAGTVAAFVWHMWIGKQ